MIPKFKSKFITICRVLANKSNHPHHQLGCVIVKKNRVLGVGYNKLKTHTKSNHIFKAHHAEFDAIIGMDNENLRGTVLYVSRIKKTGDYGLAKPCTTCQEMIAHTGIKGVWYSIDESPYWKYYENHKR